VSAQEAFKVLVDARCLEHPRRSFGVVVDTPGGSLVWESRARGRATPPSFETDRHRNTLFVDLRETSETEVEGWCRDCRKVRLSDEQFSC
jgi:hypothetical protein